MHKVYLSIGTNLGDRNANISRAVELLRERVGEVVAKSSVIETEPVGFKSENNFYNCAIAVSTQLSPFDLLEITQQIEKEMGRTLKSVNGIYHDRVIDIDILLYDDLAISTPKLTIPHPRMNEREFVMVPLREINENQAVKA